MSDRKVTIAGVKYAAPNLVVYGGMATLTASGSQTGQENTGAGVARMN